MNLHKQKDVTMTDKHLREVLVKSMSASSTRSPAILRISTP